MMLRSGKDEPREALRNGVILRSARRARLEG
jgi:hypothetical protein